MIRKFSGNGPTLTLETNIINASAGACCFDADSAATLIHTFVTSRIDYCNCLFVGASNVWTDKLQRFLNTAARVLTETHKYHPGLTWILYSDLHWLDVPERIKYKLRLTVSSASMEWHRHTSQNCVFQSQNLVMNDARCAPLPEVD